MNEVTQYEGYSLIKIPGSLLICEDNVIDNHIFSSQEHEHCMLYKKGKARHVSGELFSIGDEIIKIKGYTHRLNDDEIDVYRVTFVTTPRTGSMCFSDALRQAQLNILLKDVRKAAIQECIEILSANEATQECVGLLTTKLKEVG